MSFEIYSSDDLPDGFKYPEEFRKISGAIKFDELYPWWFIDASTNSGIHMRRHIFEKHLIPFAKTDYYDDIACFDAADHSGNPKIIMLCSTQNRSYSFTDFNTWLKAAKTESKEHGRA